MKVINLGESNSALNNIIAQVRDRKIQKDSLRFRFNLERLGQIFAYEVSKTLVYSPKEVMTPSPRPPSRLTTPRSWPRRSCGPVCPSTRA